MTIKQDTRTAVASRLIDGFLIDRPNPSTAEWKDLLVANPELATEIAHAALIGTGATPLSMSALDEPLDTTLFNATVSKVLNKVASTPSPLLEAAKAQVDAVKGPAARKLATEIGVNHVTLVNGMLSGSIAAPTCILAALTDRLKVSTAALMEVFHRSFFDGVVSAHQADGKPEVTLQPITWEIAVRSLNLGTTETHRLLQLGDQE